MIGCGGLEFRINIAEYAIIALGKLQAFLIQQVQEVILSILEELKKSCPPPDRLEQLSNTINNARQAINGVQKKAQKIEKMADLLTPIIAAAKLFVLIQCNRPDWVSTPIEGPLGAPTGAATKGRINKMTNRVDRFKRLIDAAQDAQFAIKAAVTTFNTIFIPILTALNIIQTLLDRCATRQDLSDEERKLLLDKIQGKTDEIYRIGIQYRSTKSGRVYTIKIVKDPNSPDIAPKRQAIAQDFRGITVLTGPSSFASSTDVLVDELKFRIENQLP